MGRANILVDTCIWISLFNPVENENHSKALDIINDLENNNILVPWPTLYEFINTKLARRKENLFSFEQTLLKPNVYKISDEKYKEFALEKIFEINRFRYNSVSLVDEIIKQMICDKSLKIDFLATFNDRDFEYFCQKENIIILK